ncbi:MAG: formylglycine-generating enzyme family protein [Spirochaetales bacterium]|jgi:formylglycine-generating enzyme required for sulfatase activity|nr:formylglycine-generating enzyme family protein [Spirochaetales bacterium]
MKKMCVIILALCLVPLFAVRGDDNMVRISGGTFTMGSPASEPDRDDDETRHPVRVSDFSISRYEVTQKEYRDIMGTDPSDFKGDTLPVENVSWFDAIEYCNRRSLMEKLTPAYTVSGSGDWREITWNREADGYRLPTEAEWEYACRAGTTTPYSSGGSVDSAGWYWNNSGQTTRPVGQKQPNAWGLYDMHGNVWEWCWDWYGEYPDGAQADPSGAASGSGRVLRGGSWGSDARILRSANRDSVTPTPSGRDHIIGFRLARP